MQLLDNEEDDGDYGIWQRDMEVRLARAHYISGVCHI